MNEATLDRWITMRMLTEEVGEVDLDGYRITVVERAVEKLHFEDPEFEYTIRITKLRDVPKDTWRPSSVEELKAKFDAMAAAPKAAPKRKGKAK